LFTVKARLMKWGVFCANKPARCIRSAPKLRGETFMSKKPVVRKPSKKIADSRRVRFGAGSAPRVIRALDKATQDSRTIRFGAGSAPASLRK
jgi:hypothetical protein